MAKSDSPVAASHRGPRLGPQVYEHLVHEVRRRTITTPTKLGTAVHHDSSAVGESLKILAAARAVHFVPGKGRRASTAELEPSAGIMVGVDITDNRIRVVATDAGYKPLPVHASTSPRKVWLEGPEGGPDKVLPAVAEAVAERLVGIGADRLIGVGLCLPGPILRGGVPASSSILPGWLGVPVAQKLTDELISCGVVPFRARKRNIVWVENDSSLGALGVFTHMVLARRDNPLRSTKSKGEVKTQEDEDREDENLQRKLEERLEDLGDLFYLRVTRGIGGGIVAKSHLLTGGSGFAAEIGHLRIAPRGRLCPLCGGRGCLETVASERAFREELQGVSGLGKGLPDDLAVADFLAGDHGAHPAVQQALWEAGWNVGAALGIVCSLLNPGRIVLGGAMTETETFLNAARGALARHAMPPSADDEHLELETWKHDVAGRRDTGAVELTPELLGALAAVLDQLGDGYFLPPVRQWTNKGGHAQSPPLEIDWAESDT